MVLTAFKVDGKASSTHWGQEQTSLRRGRKQQQAGGACEAPPPSERWRPAVFSNLPVVMDRGHVVVGSDEGLSCVDAALRSSAAPTYFPLYQGYCDGAVTANNPSLVAVSMVRSWARGQRARRSSSLLCDSHHVAPAAGRPLRTTLRCGARTSACSPSARGPTSRPSPQRCSATPRDHPSPPRHHHPPPLIPPPRATGA